MSDLIRRADARNAVQDHFNAGGFKGYDDGQKMMDRINALPSAETHEIRTETHGVCSDLINRLPSADAVSREECNCVFSKPKIKLPKKAVEFNFSNIEVVVRCKDCRYFKKIVERSDSGLCYRDLVASAWKENGYCSRGERNKYDSTNGYDR